MHQAVNTNLNNGLLKKIEKTGISLVISPQLCYYFYIKEIISKLQKD